MRAGRLRHTVEIEERTETASASGEVTYTWSKKAIRKAAIEPMSGSELMQAQQIDPAMSHQVTVRFLPGLTSKDRMKFYDSKTKTDRYFNIRSVLTTAERWRVQVCMCVEDIA